jgi:hypothetical protein
MAQGLTYSGSFGPQYGWGSETLLTGPAPAAAGGSGFMSSIGGAGGAVSILGGVSQAIGAYYSARSSKSSLKHQAKMGAINARINELGARSAMLQGQRQEQAVRLNTAHMKSAQRTGFAARGVALDSGSVQNILNTTDYMGEVDALTVQRNTLQAAWGYRMQAANQRGAAAMARADASGISPFGAAATSLIGSATAVAPRWYASQNARV